MTARLPTDVAYTPAVEKEDRWLPVLAPHLPVPIPEPVALGQPGAGYPFPWSVRRWLEGVTAGVDTVPDLTAFAADLAEFVLALQRVETGDGPRAGAHSFHRGAPPAHYDEETRAALDRLDGHVDVTACTAVWDAALASTWEGPDVWFHGDIAAGNLLVRNGQLAAVIDFGTSGVGDPACDLVIAWTLFDGASRQAFRKAVGQDEGTWARARGWALWKALITLVDDIDGDPTAVAGNQRVIARVLDDHARSGRSLT
jgi:aminoglycoside phosphotransferase (APT) family kinase protein